MSRRQKSVVVFPKSDPKQNPLPDESQAHRRYLEYLLDLADRLLQRRVDDDGSQAA